MKDRQIIDAEIYRVSDLVKRMRMLGSDKLEVLETIEGSRCSIIHKADKDHIVHISDDMTKISQN